VRSRTRPPIPRRSSPHIAWGRRHGVGPGHARSPRSWSACRDTGWSRRLSDAPAPACGRLSRPMAMMVAGRPEARRARRGVGPGK
jgi:hypothetical protein